MTATRTVFIRGLVLPARIGVYRSEHGRAQRISIDLEFDTEDPGGVGADDVRRVVDYAAVVDRIRAIVAAGTSSWSRPWPSGWPRRRWKTNVFWRRGCGSAKLDILPDGAVAGVEVSRRR